MKVSELDCLASPQIVMFLGSEGIRHMTVNS